MAVSFNLGGLFMGVLVMRTLPPYYFESIPGPLIFGNCMFLIHST